MAVDMSAETEAEPLPAATMPLRLSTSAVFDRRTNLARAIVAIIARTIPDEHRLTIQLDDEADPGEDAAAGARVRIRGPDAVARLIFPPSLDAFAEAYLRGDIEIDGDVGAAVEAGQALDVRRLRPTDLRRLIRFGVELRRTTPSPLPLGRVASLTGRRHSRARDLAAVRFHYDVGEDFYRLWLDRRLTYSCAYFETADDPAAHLDAAQEAKLDLICRKLRLRPGQRLLDIGCG